MEQLIMYWNNDHTTPKKIELPEGFEIKSFPELPGAIDHWLDIMQYGLSEKREDREFYHNTMENRPCYNEDKCFFVLVNGSVASSITVICNYETKEGYIHMVACKEEFRGKGIGTLMNDLAINVLKREGMEKAHLTTDDWRIPAIKSYLRCGLVPDESTEDFKERWAAIREKIGK